MNELYLRNIVDKTPNIYKFKVLFKKKYQIQQGGSAVLIIKNVLIFKIWTKMGYAFAILLIWCINTFKYLLNTVFIHLSVLPENKTKQSKAKQNRRHGCGINK